MTRHPLLGYTDASSFRPGESVPVRVSSARGSTVEATLVRFLDGSPRPGADPAPVAEYHEVTVTFRAEPQNAVVGSWFEADLTEGDTPNDQDVSVGVWIQLLSDLDQTGAIVFGLGRREAEVPQLGLSVAPKRTLAVEVDGEAICATEQGLAANTWYKVIVDWRNHTVGLAISSRAKQHSTHDHVERVEGETPRNRKQPDIVRAGSWRPEATGGTFSGRIAELTIHSGSGETGEVIASWDFGVSTETWTVVDSGPNAFQGQLHNAPTRLLPGPKWDPLEGGIPTPATYDAVHLHSDDVGDLGWELSGELSLPDHAPSGVYAVRLRGQSEEMHIPFAVRGEADVALLLPTLTYLSYANHRMFTERGELFEYISDHDIQATEREALVVDHPFLGRSIYDLHDDGTGVSQVTRARPIVNLEPAQLDWLGKGPHHFAADLYLVGWLGRTRIPYSVLTDEDLHAEGTDALGQCRVLVTGSHPEYWTTPMMRALRSYLDHGGNLMYLGANGFYWVTSLSQNGNMMEVRRGFTGSRAWTSRPGETVHAFDGAEGGLWRNRGYGPFHVGGVGMASQGWGTSVGYRRLPDSFDPRVASFFKGIGDDEPIGDFGFLAGGAAGYEVDRLDTLWGSPPETLRLATSEKFADYYQLTVEYVENMTSGYGGTTTPEVRADMVWFKTPGGGQVFSTGSISWASALGWNGGDNNVDTITTNVLRAFLGNRRPSNQVVLGARSQCSQGK